MACGPMQVGLYLVAGLLDVRYELLNTAENSNFHTPEAVFSAQANIEVQERLIIT